jgi:cytochrome c oxidase subunit 2
MENNIIFKFFETKHIVFLIQGNLSLPKNYSINFQHPATFAMENIIIFHHDVMFYLAATFPFILFLFLELNMYWINNYFILNSTNTNLHINFFKNIIININNFILLFFYSILYFLYLFLFNWNNIWIFTSHFSFDDKYNKNFFLLNTNIRYTLQNIFISYFKNIYEITEILFINKLSFFQLNNNFLHNFITFKIYNLFKFNLFFTNEQNYINANNQMLNYFFNLIFLVHNIFEIFKKHLINKNNFIYFNLLNIKINLNKYSSIYFITNYDISFKNFKLFLLNYHTNKLKLTWSWYFFSKIIKKDIYLFNYIYRIHLAFWKESYFIYWDNYIWFFDYYILEKLDYFVWVGYSRPMDNYYIIHYFLTLKNQILDYDDNDIFWQKPPIYINYEKLYNYHFSWNWSKYINTYIWFIFQRRLLYWNFLDFILNIIFIFEKNLILYIGLILNKIFQFFPNYFLLKKFLWNIFYSYYQFCISFLLLDFTHIMLKKKFSFFYKISSSLFTYLCPLYHTFNNNKLKYELYSDSLKIQWKKIELNYNYNSLFFLSKNYYNINKEFYSILENYELVHLINNYTKMNSKINKNYFLLEIIWTLLPTCLVILILIPSLNLLYSLEFLEVDPLLNLKIIGNQWYWTYEYSSNIYNYEQSNYKNNIFEHLEFNSFMLDPEILYSYIPEENIYLRNIKNLSVDRNILLPTNVHIQLLITSNDVLHSWAIPAFGIKMDACPGRLNIVQLFIKKEGIFYGQCSELCGINHGFMPIVVHACNIDFFFLSFVFRNFSLFEKFLENNPNYSSLFYKKNKII